MIDYIIKTSGICGVIQVERSSKKGNNFIIRRWILIHLICTP